MTLLAAGALTLAALAAVTDLRHRRIPNWLTLGGLALGLALNFAHHTPLEAVKGAALAFAIHLPLFALKFTSGGDVKLMTALGAIAGPRHWLTIFAFSAVLGGLAALALVWRKKRLGETAANLAHLLQGERNLDKKDALTLPRGPIAALAVALWILTLR